MKTAFATSLLFLCTTFGLVADTEENRNDPNEIAIRPEKGSISAMRFGSIKMRRLSSSNPGAKPAAAECSG